MVTLFYRGKFATASLISVLLVAAPALADYSKITYTATVTGVEIDTGGGTFTGLAAGNTISGEFRIGVSAEDATEVFSGATYTEYVFRGGDYRGSVSGASSNFLASNALLYIEDNHLVTQEEIAMVSEAFPDLVQGLNLNAGNPVDSWGIGTASQNVIYDDEADCLVDGLEFEIVLVDVDGTMFNDTTFRGEPPSQGDIELPIFFLEQADGTTGCENTVYSAHGVITDIQYELVQDPEPENKAMPWVPLLLEE